MRKPSKYLSEQFIHHIWPVFSSTLKNKSSQTDYFTNVCMICDYLKEDFIRISSDHAQAYFDALASDRNKPLTKKTLVAKLSYLRSLYTHILMNKTALGLHHLTHNPFYNVKVDEFDYYINPTSIPTLTEIDKMFITCKNNATLFLILSLIFRCSLTASEVCSLSPKQIGKDANGNGFMLFKKRNIERYVKIPEDIMELIISYTAITGEREYLFYNQRNQVLQLRSLEMMFKDLQQKANIKKQYTLRDLRNASIAYMLRAGAKANTITEYTGVTNRWIYRYDKVIPELDIAPCDYSHIKIVT